MIEFSGHPSLDAYANLKKSVEKISGGPEKSPVTSKIFPKKTSTPKMAKKIELSDSDLSSDLSD